MKARDIKGPDSIIAFSADTNFTQPETIWDDFQNPPRLVVVRESKWAGTTIELVVNIPESVFFAEGDRQLNFISFIRQTLQDWEHKLKNPEYSGMEPQLGTKNEQ